MHSIYWERIGTKVAVSIPELKQIYLGSSMLPDTSTVGDIFETSSDKDLATILEGLSPVEEVEKDPNRAWITALGKVFRFDSSKKELGIRYALGIANSDITLSDHPKFREVFYQKTEP